jgi:hypothetical protein
VITLMINPFAQAEASPVKKTRAKRSSSKSISQAIPCEEVEVDEVKVVKSVKAPAKKKKKTEVILDLSVPADVSRSHLGWLDKEEDAIMDLVMDESLSVTLFDLAAKFKKEAMLVALHILGGDIPEMAGFEANKGSEEEAEFLGLALGGAPIALALRWCAATDEQDDRPTTLQVQTSLTRGDLRGAMNLVRESGIWFSSLDQLEYLALLQDMDPKDVSRAVAGLIERIEAPSPKMVFEQLCGLFDDVPVVNWRTFGACCASTSRGSHKTTRASYKTSSRKSTTTVIKAGTSTTSTTYKKKSSSKKWGTYSGYTKKSKPYTKKSASFAF